ncbi:MAG: hypothetical protein GWO20_15515 [Candidatus Korarchaeota archaeon]|nr:hypothetical protein [Candidatus Korarchaeota archaeon]NIU82629.1 hypothetical protein [Candidatus Thorarchaeota archaeon]NIW13111.1 hypothetical protein [Candidatus Thorarchaeota archaeon]NIW51277.1 hypothetical protein [Candidatus Korarchaeota archaeon]
MSQENTTFAVVAIAGSIDMTLYVTVDHTANGTATPEGRIVTFTYDWVIYLEVPGTINGTLDDIIITE